MNRFLQLHLLTPFGPANLNRDDLGRPKTAIVGGAPRLRISSQSLKRAWRTSDVFADALRDKIGVRTKELGVEVRDRMLESGAHPRLVEKAAQQIAAEFGKLRKLTADDKKQLGSDDLPEKKRRALEDKPYQIEQLAHLSSGERQAVHELASTLAAENREPTKEELRLLRKDHGAADIALFGRMLAAQPAFNSDAACQVAHAITVHKVQVEDDFFTAVDDLNEGEDDVGAGHMGEIEFGAGVFYGYVCLDRALLGRHLGDASDDWKATIEALVECAATVAPTGKQNSFASRARAMYVVAEKGDQQPRSLMAAFVRPVYGQNQLQDAIDRLSETSANMDKAYGDCAESRYRLDATEGEGTMTELKAFAVSA